MCGSVQGNTTGPVSFNVSCTLWVETMVCTERVLLGCSSFSFALRSPSSVHDVPHVLCCGQAPIQKQDVQAGQHQLLQPGQHTHADVLHNGLANTPRQPWCDRSPENG